MIFKTCPYCGANLDPEEICDCLQGGYNYATEIGDVDMVDYSEDVVNEIVNDKELMDYIKEHRKV